jgi:hypothetical protein
MAAHERGQGDYSAASKGVANEQVAWIVSVDCLDDGARDCLGATRPPPVRADRREAMLASPAFEARASAQRFHVEVPQDA